MFTHERHEALLELLERRRRLPIGDLLRALRCSPATLRRDLADLERDGRLVRFHGGAAHPLYLRGEASLEQRSREQIADKRAMGRLAADLVAADATVFIDAGTSCLEAGRNVLARRDVTIVTNSLALAEAARAGNARVLCLGGEVRGVTGALVGALSQSWVDHLNLDVALLGASGLSEDGPSTTELGESAIKQAVLRRARRAILLADGGKWGRPAPVRFAPWSAFARLVTTGDLPPAAARKIGRLGPRVALAKPLSRTQHKERNAA